MDRELTSRRPRCNNGYSLIEVLVAGVVIAAVVVGIFSIISGGSELNRKDMLRRRAFQELERILERPEYSSRAPYYLDLAAPKDTTLVAVTIDSTGSAPLTGSPLVRVRAVTFNFNGLTIPAKRITAKITYTDKGVAYAESLETCITLTDLN